MDYHMRITDNYITVDRQRLNLREVVEWVKKYCPHYITNQYHNHEDGEGLIDFFFLDRVEARKEMAWFILKWT